MKVKSEKTITVELPESEAKIIVHNLHELCECEMEIAYEVRSFRDLVNDQLPVSDQYRAQRRK